MRDDQNGNTECVRCRARLIKDKQHSDRGNLGTGGCFYCSHCAHRDSLYEPLKYLLSSAYVPRTKLRSSRFYGRKRRHELSRTGFRFCQQKHYVCFSPLSVLLHISLWCVSFLAHPRASFHFFALFWACCPYFVNVEMIHNVNIFFSSACAFGYYQTVFTGAPGYEYPLPSRTSLQCLDSGDVPLQGESYSTANKACLTDCENDTILAYLVICIQLTVQLQYQTYSIKTFPISLYFKFYHLDSTM